MIGIIGGGISGLAVAYHLHQQGTPYVLLEANAQVGGVIRSKHEDGYWLELGPNSVLCDAEVKNRLYNMGLQQDIIEANEVSKHRYIYRNGAYRQLPSSPPSLLLNQFFSWKTKWAIFQERNNKSQASDSETLDTFFRRRFSQELVDYALDPFVAGIYAGDPQKLLIQYTFPQLLAYEREYGSIIRGFIKNKTGQRKVTVSFKKGMAQLPEQMAKGLNIVLEAAVQNIEPVEQGYKLVTAKGIWEVEKLVIATPAHTAGQLLQKLAPDYASKLEQVNYAPMTVIHSAFPEASVGFKPNGFGGLHPRKEGLFTAGHIWSSAVFDGKCPKGEVLFTSFVGGTQGVEKTQLSDEEIQQKAIAEVQKLYKISSPPKYQSFFRWKKAIPQYDEAIKAIYEPQPELEAMNIHFCSNFKGGVSIPDCLRKGEDLARRLVG